MSKTIDEIRCELRDAIGPMDIELSTALALMEHYDGIARLSARLAMVARTIGWTSSQDTDTLRRATDALKEWDALMGTPEYARVPSPSILAEANAGLGGLAAITIDGRTYAKAGFVPALDIESTTEPFAVTVTQPSTGHPSGDELLMTNAMTALAKSFGWEIKHELQPCGRVLITRFTPGRGE